MGLDADICKANKTRPGSPSGRYLPISTTWSPFSLFVNLESHGHTTSFLLQVTKTQKKKTLQLSCVFFKKPGTCAFGPILRLSPPISRSAPFRCRGSPWACPRRKYRSCCGGRRHCGGARSKRPSIAGEVDAVWFQPRWNAVDSRGGVEWQHGQSDGENGYYDTDCSFGPGGLMARKTCFLQVLVFVRLARKAMHGLVPCAILRAGLGVISGLAIHRAASSTKLRRREGRFGRSSSTCDPLMVRPQPPCGQSTHPSHAEVIELTHRS